MSFKEWLSQQTRIVECPSGLKVRVRMPDYFQLLKDWREAGVTAPLEDAEERARQLGSPPVMASILRRYVVEPELSPEEAKQLVNDYPTTAQIIYSIVIGPFVTQTEDIKIFMAKWTSPPDAKRGGHLQRLDGSG